MKKLDKKNIEDILSLTPVQEGMLFHYLKDTRSHLYFEQLCLEISGEIHYQSFEQAWSFVVRSNEMLRTLFRWEKMDKPTQVILKAHNPTIRSIDLTRFSPKEKEKQSAQIKTADKNESFDLHDVPFRITLIQLEKEKHLLVISNHHILYDGWSNGIILAEFFRAYHDLYREKTPVRPSKAPFKEYIKGIKYRAQSNREKFWSNYLKGFDQPVEFSIKSARESQPVPSVSLRFPISDAVQSQLETFARRRKLTAASLFYSAWGLLLQRYNNTPDVVFGTTVSGRNTDAGGIENIVGLFINTPPLRVQTLPGDKTAAWLRRIHNSLKKRTPYEQDSLVKIKEYSPLTPDENLFDTILVIENYPLSPDARLDNADSLLSVDSYSTVEMTHYDLTVGIHLYETIELDFSYNPGLFEESTIQRLAVHFLHLLEALSLNAPGEVDAIDILSEEERTRLLIEFNNTDSSYHSDITVIQLFEEQVERTPQAVALVEEASRITFKELNKISNRLANLLSQKNTKPDSIVAIMVKSSLSMIIGILGILKSGAAYLPIDPELPEERIRFMLEDSGAGILLLDPWKRTPAAPPLNEAQQPPLSRGELDVIELTGLKELFQKYRTSFFESISKAAHSLNSPLERGTPRVAYKGGALSRYQDHLPTLPPSDPFTLAYIIYTSGSTGKPKGVLIEHRSLNNACHWYNKNYSVTSADRAFQYANIIFDASVLEIFPYLITGAEIHLLADEIKLDIYRLNHYFEANQISIGFLPTQVYEQFMTIPNRSLRVLITAGDKLRRFKPGNYQLVNNYGPTENTVVSTCFTLDRPYHNIPIGKPIGNTRIYILDNHFRLQPVGVAGQLCITGHSLARGYLNRPELTKEKFKVQRANFELPSTLYQSGDMARWLPDGNIEFLARIDHQVKIRGFRIETGEIETQLLNHENVSECVVIARETENQKGDKYLCAYVIPVPDGFENNAAMAGHLKDYLSLLLPDYMIPAYFVPLERIPLTPSGKPDRKQLPEPGLNFKTSRFVTPRSDLEHKLVQIWSDVLGVSPSNIGVTDLFFELGGNSLSAIGLIGRIHKQLSVELPLSQLFKVLTIRRIAQFIEKAARKEYRNIEPVEEKEYYPLAPTQKQFYAIHQLNPSHTGYNMPETISMEGRLSKEAVETAFRQLIRGHEILRTSFHQLEGEPVQIVHDHVEFEVQYCEAENFVQPFDLSSAPLLRVGLKKVEEQRHLFLFDAHHIILDGLSAAILINRFMALYSGQGLEPPAVRYKDYVNWTIKRAKSHAGSRPDHESPADAVPREMLNLPLDYQRPLVQSFEGNTIRFETPVDQKEALLRLAMEAGTTLYTLLLSVFYIFLSKLGGQQDIAVGSPIAGRDHQDLDGVIGLFIKTVVLRSFPQAEKQFPEFLAEVNRNFLEASEQPRFHYEYLLEHLNLPLDSGRNPVYDVMFVLQNMDTPELEIPGLKLTRGLIRNRTSKLDLSLSCEEKESLVFNLEYSTRLFKEETIRRFTNYFSEILSCILENPEVKLSEIEIIPPGEKHRVLYDFNTTSTDYSPDKTIHQLFEEQVERTPDRIAVIDTHQSTVTYSELDRRSNHLAHVLNQKGVQTGTIVGIMMERSIEMVICIFGILKAGGAYLPIDSKTPEKRTRYMLEDSGAGILLLAPWKRTPAATSPDGARQPPLSSGEFGSVEITELPGILNSPFERGGSPKAGRGVSSGDLAYAIYISGSTGNPKGVLVQHRSVVNLLEFLFDVYPFSQSDTYLLKTSYTFDVSVSELFGWYLGGGRLALLEPGAEMDPQRIIDSIEAYRVSHINFVPSMFRVFLQSLSPRSKHHISFLKYIFLAGEALPPDYVEQFNALETNITLENIYGPTEGTVYASRYSLMDWSRAGIIPIGKPIQNTQLYILDPCNHLQPIGIAGELCIGGEGLARGYLNRPELTAERFVNWVLPAININIYKTGDLARWLPDGDIEFLGRIDHQVKIRGFRIELGEIENQLLKHDGLKEALVTVNEGESDREDKYLCAYVVPDARRTGKPGTNELRDFLSHTLPDYMIPSHFVLMETIPLTPSGKPDRKQPPEPGMDFKAHRHVAPVTRLEKDLVDIWSGILGMEPFKIGVNDRFFELGGHSLRAVRLKGLIYKTFHVEFPFSQLFKTPTIREIALFIENAVKREYRHVEPVEEKEYYPLFSTQKQFYAIQQLNPSDTSYNIPETILMEGRLSKETVETAFKQLINRHESLRTSFHQLKGEAVQRIHPEVEFGVESREPGTDDAIKDFGRPFDLTRAPLIRVGLKKVEEDKHLLLFDAHHIIVDGVSAVILIKEFMALCSGKNLVPLAVRYKDYVNWTIKGIQSRPGDPGNQDHVDLDAAVPEETLNIPLDYARPVVQSFEGGTIRFEAGENEKEALLRLALEAGTTLYTLLLSIFNIFLSKLVGQEDIAVGSPIAGRDHHDLDGVVGLFIKTVVLRSFPVGEKQFLEFLAEVNSSVLEAFEQPRYHYEELLEKLGYPRESGRNPIYDVMFVLQNLDTPELEIPGLKLTRELGRNRTSKLDLSLSCEEKESLVFDLEYSTRLFKEESIRRFISHFRKTWADILENPNLKLAEIEIITEGEKRQILYDYNNTTVDYPKEKTIHQMLEEQVEKASDRTAVIDTHGSTVTYGELNRQSNQLVHILNEKGIQSGAIVGIMMERSIEMFIGIFGILKAGAAYLPIDPKAPERRIRYMLEDSGANILLKSEKNPNDQNQGFPCAVLNFEHLDFESCFTFRDFELRASNLSPSGLAYVIYTSGSTGKPKGVPVRHSSLVDRMYWLRERLDLNENDVTLQKTVVTFDVSVCESVRWIFWGGRVVILPREDENDPEAIAGVIQNQNVTNADFIPSQLNTFLDYWTMKGSRSLERLSGLRWVITGAEVVNPVVVEKFNNAFGHISDVRLLNLYGPTETTVDVTCFDCSADGYRQYNSIPIGKPRSNTQAYILNPLNRLQPTGVAGELCIAGTGLARGYLNRPELTAERFINYKTPAGHPPGITNKNSAPSTVKLYKTGDLSRWLPDGNIEFLGRIDHQLKIRGFRIELGEIENQLLKHESIKECLVVAGEEGSKKGDKYLCAYVIPVTGGVAGTIAFENTQAMIRQLKDYLSQTLPDYMIPAYFVPLDRIPLTPSGKPDRKQLPEPGLHFKTNRFVAPGNKIEHTLVQIWSDVLGMDESSIGVTDRFFELGGNSLRAIDLTGRIHKHLNVEFPLPQLFKIPTIRGIAGFIEKSARREYRHIEPVEEKEYYPLVSTQKQFYLIWQLNPGDVGYNMSDIMLFEGRLSGERLGTALKQMIRRHDSLRTSFHQLEIEPVQRVHPEVEFGLEEIESGSESGKPDAASVIREFVRPFDLSEAPLLRVGLKKIAKDKHLFLFDTHHIIMDGVSTGILIHQFLAFYSGENFPPLAIQYKDYVNWMIESGKDPGSSQWKENCQLPSIMTDEYTSHALNLPLDQARPAAQSFEGSIIRFEAGKEQYEALLHLSLQEGATLYMTLLGVFNVFLSKLSGQENIVVGSPIAGRDHRELEGLIGLFIKTVVLQNFPSGEKSFNRFLAEIKANSLEAFENPGYQYEEVLDRLNLAREAGRNPLFDVMFTLQNMDIPKVRIPGLKITEEVSEIHISKFDMTLFCQENETLVFNLEYSTQLFKEETVHRFIKHFRSVLSGILENPEIPLGQLEIISDEEKRQVLVAFNNSTAEYPRDSVVHRLFEEQARQTPDCIAVTGPYGDTITYTELNRRSHRLAYALNEKGIRPGTIVGIMAERSIDTIIGVLGILKSGGGYLPINTDYPEERINYMLKDSGAKALVSDKEEIKRGTGINDQLAIVNYQLSTKKNSVSSAV
ncbi:MAG: amino acid adenylation domain-containing protein, partial [bacterium]|nr:amino acid adenylation domain-containing protein [bacterium]